MKKIIVMLTALVALFTLSATATAAECAEWTPTWEDQCAYDKTQSQKYEVLADDMIARYNAGEFGKENFYRFGCSYDENGTHFRAYPYYDDSEVLVYYIQVTDDENGTYFDVTLYTCYGSVHAYAVPNDWEFEFATGEFESSHARAELVEEFNYLYDEFINL